MSYLHFVDKSKKRLSSTDDQMTKKDWLAVSGASLAAFMAVLDIQVTNASLREIQGSLGLDMSESGWLSTAYLIAETIVIPLTGYLSNVFGIRRFMLISSFLFILSSILCGLSWNLPSMIIFRSIQGIAGGALIPMAFQILLVFIPSSGRHLGMVIFGITATLAPTIGPSLGGWLTDHFSWRYIFFINIFPGTAMMYLIYKGINSAKINFETLKQIDLLGIISLALGLGTLTYTLEEGASHQWFESRNIQVCTLISLISITSFIILQFTKKNPLLNLSALGERNFLLTSLITMISGMALYGGVFALSLYLGQIQNYSAGDIGGVIMWLGVPQLFVMPLLPWLMKHVNLKLLAALGILMFSYSNYLNGFMDANYAGENFQLSLLIRALGQPLFMIPISTIGMSLVNQNNAGNASSIFNMMRNLGGSIGVALAGTFLIGRQQQHFSNIVSHLKVGNSLLYESLYKIEMGLRSMGLDITSAKSMSLKSILGAAYRDSFIESFNDIFIILAIALLFSIILIILLKPIKISPNQHAFLE